MGQERTKLGLIGLIAIVVGGVIGGGIFNISKILAEGASLGAILISLGISGIGILGIALTFTTLNTVRPELSRGIYRYSRAGFGEYAGFNIAWGYWIGTALGNVVFSVMLNDAFGIFFPVLLKHSWPTLILSSCFTWFFAWVVSRGLKVATAINTVSTIVKFSSLVLIIILLFSFADYHLLDIDFWGKESHMGPLSKQIDSTMLTTLFFFMGVEGAIIVAARAKYPEEVGKATIIGYLICLFLNIIVCVLSFGFVTQSEMIHLNDPALAQVLEKGVGDWARIFVNVSVIIAVAGAWLVSTIIASELPASAAEDGVLPHFFARRNKQGTPVGALLITTCFIQVALFLVSQVHNVYIFSVDLSGIMILPTYILSAMFLIKLGLKKHIYATQPVLRQVAIITGTFTTFYCLWVIYAGNARLLLLSSGVYLIGIFFYHLAYRQNEMSGKKLYTVMDRYLIGLMVAALAFSLLSEWKIIK